MDDEPKYKYPTLDDMLSLGNNPAFLRAMQEEETRILRSTWGPLSAEPRYGQGLNSYTVANPGMSWDDPMTSTSLQDILQARDDVRARYQNIGFNMQSIPVPYSGTIPFPQPQWSSKDDDLLQSIYQQVNKLTFQWIGPNPDPDGDLKPRLPVEYSQSTRAQARRAVFTAAHGTCPRCGRNLSGEKAVRVAPPGLPRTVVHAACLEIDDQVGEPPDAE